MRIIDVDELVICATGKLDDDGSVEKLKGVEK